jgi:hypothetical protein
LWNPVIETRSRRARFHHDNSGFHLHIEHKVVTTVGEGAQGVAEPSDEDREALRRMRRAVEEREAIPPEEQIEVEDPARYQFPIGVDEQGEPFPTRRPPEHDA